MKNHTIYCNGKQQHIFNVPFNDYQFYIFQKHTEKGKTLNRGQIDFLKYPFITSVLSARKRKEKVRLENVKYYYQVKQPQLKLTL